MKHVSTPLHFDKQSLFARCRAVRSAPDFIQANAAGGIFELCKALVEVPFISILREELIDLVPVPIWRHWGLISRRVAGVLVRLKPPLRESKLPCILILVDLRSHLRSPRRRRRQFQPNLDIRRSHLWLSLIPCCRGASLHGPNLISVIIQGMLFRSKPDGKVLSELRVCCQKVNNLFLSHHLLISISRHRLISVIVIESCLPMIW